MRLNVFCHLFVSSFSNNDIINHSHYSYDIDRILAVRLIHDKDDDSGSLELGAGAVMQIDSLVDYLIGVTHVSCKNRL